MENGVMTCDYTHQNRRFYIENNISVLLTDFDGCVCECENITLETKGLNDENIKVKKIRLSDGKIRKENPRIDVNDVVVITSKCKCVPIRDLLETDLFILYDIVYSKLCVL